MKIITRGVIDWETGEVIEEESFDYCGPIAECKSSGSAPQPTDPYAQAGAQYGLATGTANYNAALNRTNSSNPLGSNTWSVTGHDGTPSSYSPGGAYGPGGGGYGGGAPYLPPAGGYPNSPAGPRAMAHPTGSVGPGSMPTNGGSGAPIYSQQTSLSPWANKLLQSPIDTSQIPGMPGGPSLENNVADARNASFGNIMQLLQPQEQQQQEQTTAQLEGEGAMPGSPAYEYGQKMLGLTQGAENVNAANTAVGTGYNVLPMMYGLGSTSLQNQLATRNAPISEYEQLQGNPSAQVSASTPDISGAFGQQYQGQLAGYNANQASNNATTGALGSLGSAAMLAFMLSDERAKTDIEKVGKLDSGPNVYRYRYKGSPTPQIGVLAQEVEETHPEAVRVFGFGGLKHVNYAAL